MSGLMGDLFSAMRIGIAAVGWTIETIMLGGLLAAKMRTLPSRIRAALAHEIACPNGHVVATYGRTQCRRCGAVRAGAWLFAECPGCKARPAFIACPRCQSAIWNPIR